MKLKMKRYTAVYVLRELGYLKNTKNNNTMKKELSSYGGKRGGAAGLMTLQNCTNISKETFQQTGTMTILGSVKAHVS